jgi:hypothetical protein
MNDAGKSTPAASAQFKASLVTIQESLKWLIASSGAAAAFVIGGLHYGGVPAGHISVLRGSLLVVAAVVGLATIFSLLVSAARILTLPRLTANDLCNREESAGVSPRGPTPDQEVTDPIVKWTLDQRTYLLGTAPTVQALYMDEYVGPRNALKSLAEGKAVQWKGQQIQPDYAPGRERITEAETAAERQLTLVEDAVHFERTRSAYRRLLWWFPIGAAALVVSIVVFAVASRLPAEQAKPRVTKPMNVDLVVVDGQAAKLPPACKSQELRGVAVDGLLRTPTVVVKAPAECRGLVIEDGHGVVVMPDADSGSSP